MSRSRLSLANLNTRNTLVAGVTNLWLALRQGSGGRRLWNLVGGGHATLTNGPTWRDTALGPAVETGVVAVNAYVDLNAFQLSRNFSMMFAYRYRYDTTTSGSNTETGILFSSGHGLAGSNGYSFRHSAGTLELLESHIASLASGAAAAANGDLHTAGFTIDNGGTGNIVLYFDGKQLATGTIAASITGSGTTALGYDSDPTSPEYGRHAFRAAALWVGRVLTAQDARRWHEAAQAEWKPFVRRRSAVTLQSSATPPPPSLWRSRAARRPRPAEPVPDYLW